MDVYLTSVDGNVTRVPILPPGEVEGVKSIFVLFDEMDGS
jgi:hypothetical protein